MQRMAALLLAERAGENACILVLGAGGGLELKAFAEWYPQWTFAGIDPSRKMLDLAARTLGSLATRVAFHEGYIDSAPPGPFDGATCLLTLHFLERDERLRTLIELRRRLKPGAPLVVAHHSFPQDEDAKAVWLNRSIAFGISTGRIAADDAPRAAEAISRHLPALSPEHDEALLIEAGFSNVDMFYAGFTFRGWVALNP